MKFTVINKNGNSFALIIIQRNLKESGLIVDEFVEAGDGAQALDAANNGG